MGHDRFDITKKVRQVVHRFKRSLIMEPYRMGHMMKCYNRFYPFFMKSFENTDIVIDFFLFDFSRMRFDPTPLDR